MERILFLKDGEITKEFDPSNVTIRTNSQDQFIREREWNRRKFNEFNKENGKFIWSYPEKVQELIKSNDFTKSDLTMFFYLATFVNGKGYLTFDNNNIKLSKQNIKGKLSVSRNVFSKLFNKLVKHEIIIPESTGYRWNIKYNFYGDTKGKANPKKLVRTYVTQIRELYEATNPDGKKKHSPIALYPVFALVPYLHHSTNIVCKNPEVKHIEDINYFNLTEVTVLLDLKNSKKVSSGLSSLLLDDQTVFVKVKSKNETYFKLNPKIFWKSSTPPDERLVAEFNMIDKNRYDK
ncbi:hypothetical protein [Rossellomorea vietnamensis]|uniref:hypothetical protein n=1 Tax=Rossellomorea vietnamensis TaxID=218284 RepID=UPI003D2A6D87